MSHLDPVRRYIEHDFLKPIFNSKRKPDKIAESFENTLTYHMQFPVARFIAEEATHVHLIELENSHVIHPWRMMTTEDGDVKLLAGIDTRISTAMRKRHSLILHEGLG